MSTLAEQVNALELSHQAQANRIAALSGELATVSQTAQDALDRLKAAQTLVETLRGSQTASQWPQRRSWKLTEPLTGDVRLYNYEIDASDVSRVIDINEGKTRSVVMVNCVIRNATSVIEGWADGLTVEMHGVRIDPVQRYGIYIESRDRSRKSITNRVANKLILHGCEFNKSSHETPLRLMNGVEAYIYDSKFINDNIAKAHIALRLHCWSALVERCYSTGTKLGHGTLPAQSLRCVDTEFNGHFKMEGCLSKPEYPGCTWTK